MNSQTVPPENGSDTEHSVDPMRSTFSIDIEHLAPTPAELLASMGYSPQHPASDRISALARQACSEVSEQSPAQAILAPLDLHDFSRLYYQAHGNRHPAPVEEIMLHTTAAGLFAGTVGPDISQRIACLYSVQQVALAGMLDAAASLAADHISGYLAKQFNAQLSCRIETHQSLAIQAYSPGYCGWDLSGQQPLFAWLNPRDIGVRLRPSHMMEPIKSVSGVLLLAPAQAHDIRPKYSFCANCRSKSCLQRKQRRDMTAARSHHPSTGRSPP